MKSKDLQKLVLSKHQKGQTISESFRDLNGTVSYDTVRRWFKMIEQTGTIGLSASPGPSRLVRTKEMIQKVKNRLKRKKKLSSQKLANELDISRTTVRRIPKNDLGYHPYKIRIVPLITDDHKAKRKKFSNWIQTSFDKEDMMRFLFSDEKMFDIDGVYNSQNDRIWAINRQNAYKAGGRMQKRKFPQKVMVWLGVWCAVVRPKGK